MKKGRERGVIMPVARLTLPIYCERRSWGFGNQYYWTAYLLLSIVDMKLSTAPYIIRFLV
jgi:hypothetical protein